MNKRQIVRPDSRSVSFFGVWGLGFGVWGVGFGVWGLGLGVGGLAEGLGFGLSEIFPRCQHVIVETSYERVYEAFGRPAVGLPNPADMFSSKHWPNCGRLVYHTARR